MIYKTKVMAGFAVVAALALGPAVAASAVADEALGFSSLAGGAEATEAQQEASPGSTTRAGNGSHWVWGVKEKVFSDYFHEGKCHGSSAWGSEKVRVTGKKAGKWSYALAKKKNSGNTAYYHVC